MLELPLKPFLDLQDVVANWSSILHAGNGRHFPDGVGEKGREGLTEIIEPLVEQLRRSDEFKMCRMAAERLVETLKDETDPHQIVSLVDDLRRRLLDQGNAMSFLWLTSVERDRYEPNTPLFGSEFESKFLSGGVFELDEAAKCLALGRSTAAVFHLMRLMEISVRAVARYLEICDPLPGDRSWGKVLENVRNGIKAKWPTVASRETGDGKLFDDLHASLDAVKNPWRNSTMHPANKYTAEEAEHIYAAVRGFAMKLASRCDENGEPKA